MSFPVKALPVPRAHHSRAGAPVTACAPQSGWAVARLERSDTGLDPSLPSPPFLGGRLLQHEAVSLCPSVQQRPQCNRLGMLAQHCLSRIPVAMPSRRCSRVAPASSSRLLVYHPLFFSFHLQSRAVFSYTVTLLPVSLRPSFFSLSLSLSFFC